MQLQTLTINANVRVLYVYFTFRFVKNHDSRCGVCIISGIVQIGAVAEGDFLPIRDEEFLRFLSRLYKANSIQYHRQ